MPEIALGVLDATLDAATSVVDTRLAGRGGPHAQRRAVQRACVVLCATAWETYAEDSIIWLAERAGAAAATPSQLAPGASRLHRLHARAPQKLRDAFAATRWADMDPEQQRADEDWITELTGGPWAELLDAELRRRVLGPRTLDGAGRHPRQAMGSPTFQVVADMQRATYGEALIEQVRVPGWGYPPDYIQYWIDTLLQVRNASVHRGETPGPLETGGVRSWITFVHDVAHDLDRHILRWADDNLPTTRPR